MQGLRQATAPLLHSKTALRTSAPSLEPLLVASHHCFDPDSSRGVIERNTSVPTLAEYDLDVLLFLLGLVNSGGTRVLWSGREILKRGS